MADTLTTAKGLTKQTPGANADTWGATLNTTLDLIDAALGQQTTIALSTGSATSTTLSATQAQKIGYKFTGAPAASRTAVFPTFYGFIFVRNATTDGSALICGMASGATVTIQSGGKALLFSDGTDFILAGLPVPVVLPATTTLSAHLRFTTGGTAISSATSGDFWFDGTNLKLQVGTALKTVTIT